MAKSFHSKLRDALDHDHLSEGRLSTADHYKLKRALREATMRGREFTTAEELAQFIATGRRFQ